MEIDKASSWRPLPNLDKDCFGCGLNNHSGLRLRFETNGRQLRTKLTVAPQFRGWSRLVHGGVLSTILDETMSWTTIVLSGRFILTKQMTVQFLRPVFVGATLCAVGEIRERRDDRRAILQAELFDEEDRLCVRAEGEFVLFTEEQFARLHIVPEEDLKVMTEMFSQN